MHTSDTLNLCLSLPLQDGNGVGVILRLVDSRVNRIYVRWNTTGIENSYRVGDFGKYDVKPYKPDRLV